MTQKICILDYGSGNVRSVFNMMSLLHKHVHVSNKPEDIQTATHLILPGVGAFGSSMKKILSKIPIEILEEQVLKRKTPFLGICVGMQVLADSGYEFGEHKGLGWIPGKTLQLTADSLPLPHVGWNTVALQNTNKLFYSLNDDVHFYFVHSYTFVPNQSESIVGKTEYGQDFCSVVQQDNIIGVQFHPEKSQHAGQVLLNNFVSL